MPKRALIAGITGQDGAYLSMFLLEKGYEVYGAYRRSASVNLWRLHELEVVNDVKLVPMDLLEFSNVLRTLELVRPDEVYNLAAQSFVSLSFEQPIFTGDVNALGAIRILEATRVVNSSARFYQASTSEMFGKAQEVPQTERTPFYPRSPYGASKLYAHWMTINYREAFGIHASSGILFNHESPLRGLEFVTRKITSGLARIRHGQQDTIDLGNLDAKRDWGFAGDYVRGMWLMLQQPEADDCVLATGEAHSVREFVELAAKAAGFGLVWEQIGEQTRGIDPTSGRTIVRVSPEYFRPSEVDSLVGDAGKARARLQWTPKINFADLVQIMVKADMDRASKGTLHS
ncbi:MAG TPA: GDP-mannose 4,6-dehydratase [bacterium]|nr:GDP-mannose 4,6-dehydratase [bacterium]